MRLTKPVKRVQIDEANPALKALAALARRGEERVVLESDGKPIAAVISARDLERLEFFEKKREEDFKVLEAGWAAFKDVPSDEIEREVAKAIAEVREEARQQRQRDAESA